MEMCQRHWDMLRNEVIAQGMGEWISHSGCELIAKVNSSGASASEYDPLMDCHNMIMDRSLAGLGLVIMDPSFGCPICFLNSRRTPDGKCACTNPECKLKEPGSVPDFETWLVGPDSCVTAAKMFMNSKGWMK